MSLTQLPNNWTWANIEELCTIIQDGNYGESYPKKDEWVENGIPFLTAAVLGNKGQILQEKLKFITPQKHATLTKAQIKTGDIIFPNRGARDAQVNGAEPFGFYIDERFPDANINPQLTLLRNQKKLISPSYLVAAINSPVFLAQFKNATTGSALRFINLKKTKQLSLPLPPLNEQRRIVEKIEALTAHSRKAREALDTIPALLDQFRQSVLAAAFRGDLTADWRRANPDVETASALLERIRTERRQRWEAAELEKMRAKGKEPKNDKWKAKYKEPTIEMPNELPETWSWTSVDEIASVGTGATPKKGELKYYEDGNIPWVTSGALNNLFIETAEDFITPVAIQETNAKLFPAHTLLVAMYGEGQTRGRVSELLIEAATNQACAALIFEDIGEKIRPIVKLFFQKNYEDIRRIASGGVQPNLNLSIIRETLVPLPPLLEQLEIRNQVQRYMSAAHEVEAQYLAMLTDTDQLNQSILAKAFRGQLVPQDPTDEPASILLERIRTEREAAAAAAKAAKKGKRKGSKGKANKATPAKKPKSKPASPQ